MDSLQQAELYALYIVIKVASYRGFERIRVGSDSNVARSQINALRASVHADSQQRILRRLFWLRCWSTVSVESFRVPSFLNAADPLSREKASSLGNRPLPKQQGVVRCGKEPSTRSTWV